MVLRGSVLRIDPESMMPYVPTPSLFGALLQLRRTRRRLLRRRLRSPRSARPSLLATPRRRRPPSEGLSIVAGLVAVTCGSPVLEETGMHGTEGSRQRFLVVCAGDSTMIGQKS